MTPRLRGRRYRVHTAVAARLTGRKADSIRKAIRRGLLEAVDLNAGTGKRPRYSISVRSLRALGWLSCEALRELGWTRHGERG